MFTLKVLGGISLVGEGSAPSGRSTQRRRLALLALVAIARERGITRDKLLAYLWAERDSEHGRHTLNQALSALRQELGEDPFLSGVDDLRLNPAVIGSDVEAFETALAKEEYERAATLYGGPLLDGFFIPDAPEFEEWTERERHRLADAYASVLEALARQASSRGEPEQAARWWRKRAAADPLDSSVAHRFMVALAAAGDRAGAIQHARVHETLLRDQLDLAPDPAVIALAERLRRESEQRETLPAPIQRPGTAVPDSARPVFGPAGTVLGTFRRVFRATPLRLALASLTVIVVAAVLARSGSPGGASTRTLVLGALSGPEANLSQAVREALRAELEASPSIRVVGDAPIRETLRLMQLPETTTVSGPIATDLAQRRGVALVVVGSVAQLGRGAQMAIELIDARSGSTLASLVERPASSDDIVPAVSRLAGALRHRVTGAPVDTSLHPLPRVSTSSLAALKNYVLARQALSRADREAAITLAEGALVHDSLFALAHYLLGDLLWYVDRQRHSDQHLTRAYQLSTRLPPRERLIVRARYEQLVRDRPDTALAYWALLRASYPDEPLAYEGLVWTYRALGRFVEAAALADSAARLDPTMGTLNVLDRMAQRAAAGDTAGAVALIRQPGDDPAAPVWRVRFYGAFAVFDWRSALEALDTLEHLSSSPGTGWGAAVQRQVILLALGLVTEGAQSMKVVVQHGNAQFPPRALLLQARAQVELRGSRAVVEDLLRRAVSWLDSADLSPPAVARLAERAADIAGRVRDERMLASLQRLLRDRDAGRGLRSYRLAGLTLDACAAFARGDLRGAAQFANAARQGMFFGRSLATIMLLEADAWAALGNRQRADSLYRFLAAPRSFAERADGDGETWAVLQRIAARAVRR